MSPTNEDYLPIKVVIPQEGDMRRPPAGGGPKKPFAELFNYDECREVMLSNLQDVERLFEPVFTKSNLPAVARVVLRAEAIAKSHRPDTLLTSSTCPIIGGENFGQILVSVKPRNLQRLVQTVRTTTTANVKNDIAKIISIEPYSARDALGAWSPDSLAEFLRENGTRHLKLRLFNHRDAELNQLILKALSELAARDNIAAPHVLNYAPSLRLYRVSVPPESALVAEFAAFVGTQSLDVFEQFTISAQSTVVSQLTNDDLPGPEPDFDYPVVGIIDSGTDPVNDSLQAWVRTRDETLVPRIEQNNKHGSLVAGMIINGRSLNHDHPGFPSGRARVVDVVAIPESGSITEDDLLDAIRHAFETHRDVRIWNMSLNSTNLCRSDRFSTFAVALDQLQDEFNTLIVNSAGNFGEHPARPWPRPDLSDRDRIYRPAESLRALTIGSIAHIHQPNACAKLGEPSPFTRKGPGAAFVPKPDLSHFGGNTNRNLQYNQMGVLSIDDGGNIAETAGTSFAAPSIALTAAQLAAAMDPPPSRHLLKAFLIHSAVLHSPTITAADLPYTGFGKPPAVEDILRCQPWEATLVFDLNVAFSHRHFHKADFPVPPCLHRNGRVYGEFILTLVYDPPVDADDGAAYSQVNVDASLGVCAIESGKEKYGGRKVIPYPKDYQELFEKSQIEHGFKWSPVKVFRRELKHGIDPKDKWRITLEVSSRKNSFAPPRQPVALIATIRDPDKQLPVYNEVVTMMNRVGWITENLRVRESTRIRATN